MPGLLPRRFHDCFVLFPLLLGSLLVLGLGSSGSAQVTSAIRPDATLGTTVTQDGTVHTITGGSLQRHNLFHSFDRFTIGMGETARFLGPPTRVDNILSRVTGGQPSVLDGLLQSDIPGAHFFLLNPQGILFGPHARLEVQGSFHVSTADFLRFADGKRFYADPGKGSVLSTAVPEAFGFLGDRPAAISVERSSLTVPEGETLSVVGGNITIQGNDSANGEIPTLAAAGGRIHIISVATAGEVLAHPTTQPTDFHGNTFERLGEVIISDLALIDTSGDGGGTVVIRSSHLQVDNSFLVADTLGARDGAAVGIDIKVTDEFTHSLGCIETGTFGTGHAGDIQITANRIVVTDIAQIRTFTAGPGVGGNVTLKATERVSLRDISPDRQFSSGIFVDAEHEGSAGSIVVETPTLHLSDGARIESLTVGPGTGGNITVTATNVSLTNGAQLNSLTDGLGSSGSVAITASDAVSIAGPSQMSVQALGKDLGAGDAGTMVVTASRVTLTGGGEISSSTRGLGSSGSVTVTASAAVTVSGSITRNGTTAPSGIGAQARERGERAGNAGGVVVTAPRVLVTGGGLISSSTFGPGRAGNVTVTATDTVTVSGASTSPRGSFRSGITALSSGSTDGAGDAGVVVVTAPRILVTDGAQISSATQGPGRGGNLAVTATDTVALSGPQGGLFTDTTSSGAGGDISLQAPVIALTAGAIITAESTGTGNAGRIDLIATGTFSSTDSAVTTAALAADGGNIALQVGGLLRLRNSAITATVGGGPATAGGNITSNSALILLENSTIQANAFAGRGGNVALTARGVVIDAASTVRASSERGIDGTVAIQALTNVTEAIAPLPQTVTPAVVLARDHCAVPRREERVSSFVVHLQGSLPAAPGDFLPGVLFERAPSREAPHEGDVAPESPSPRAGDVPPDSPRSRQDRQSPGVFHPLHLFECVGGG